MFLCVCESTPIRKMPHFCDKKALPYLLVLWGNPISQTMISTLSGIAKSAGIVPKKLPEDSVAVIRPLPPLKLSSIAGGNYHFVRLAGLCGASAIVMGAYGKYALQNSNADDIKNIEDRRIIFDSAYRFHFFHSFALFAMPLANRPALTGTLMAIGALLFSGPMYYRAFTGDKRFIHISTCGGFCLIAAWLSLIF